MRYRLPVRTVTYIFLAMLFHGAVMGSAEAQSGPTNASAVDAQLQGLREKILYAQYDQAKEPLKKLAGDSTLTARQRANAMALYAQLQIALGDAAGSRQTLKDLYARDPDYRLEDENASPRVMDAFKQARGATVSHINVQMENTTPPREVLRQQPMVKLRVITYLDAVDELDVHYRQGGEKEFTKIAVDLDAKGMGQARFPTVAAQGDYDIEFFVDALAPSGAKLAYMGTRDNPLRITVPAAHTCTNPNDPACRCEFSPKSPGCPYCFENPDEAACSNDPCRRDPEGQECYCQTHPDSSDCDTASEGGSVFGKWWFWTVVGVVVVGGATAAVIGLSGGDDPLEGSFGTGALK